MRMRAVLVTALSVTLFAAPAQALPAPTMAARPAIVTAGEILTAEAADFVTWINAERAAAGLTALRIDASLTQVALGWTGQMAATGVLSHNPYTGVQIPAGWTAWGENVGWTQPADAARLHSAFMSSPGHRANIMNSQFTHVGIGWMVDVNGRSWVTEVFARYPSGASLPRFADVPVGAVFYADIEWAVTSGVATGYTGGIFRPTAAVTREAMAAFLYRAVQGSAVPACGGGQRTFSDVPAAHPFCGAIEWLAANGITTGYPDGTFRPGDPVSREAIAAFLYRSMTSGDDPECTSATRRFTDVRAADTFCGVIEWTAAQGISTGWTDGTYRPCTSVARQAMAAFLHRAFT